jgi:hypothetical protein
MNHAKSSPFIEKLVYGIESFGIPFEAIHDLA